MADITANVDAWSSTEASNSPSGSTTIGTGLDDNLRAIQAAFKVWQARIPHDGSIFNGRITASVGSSALTLALKGKDGNDPSSTNKVYIAFRSSTASSSDWNIREVTAALSVVVSSGSTLGHASGIVNHLFVYAIDNSGTVELAVSNLPPDYPGTFGSTRLISTTAEGGAGAADSATGIYSTTARSNVPWVCLAMCKSNQATAGTWASAPTQLDMAPFSIPLCSFGANRATTQTIGTSSYTKVQFNVEETDLDSTYDNATNYRHQPNVAGLYRYSAGVGFESPADGVQMAMALTKNGSNVRSYAPVTSGTATLQGSIISGLVLMNGTTDYMEGYCYQGSGGNLNTIGSNAQNVYFDGARVSS